MERQAKRRVFSCVDQQQGVTETLNIRLFRQSCPLRQETRRGKCSKILCFIVDEKDEKAAPQSLPEN
jgi:hypothetical protein